jgi:hypothetical protein
MPAGRDTRRADLVADCSRCAAICCVATAFDASEDFAIAKPAGVACPNLAASHRCAIHGELAARGFGGCVAFECYGAGPRLARALVAPGPRRDAAFRALVVVHELLWLLTEAAKLRADPPPDADLGAAIAAEIAALDAIAAGPIAALARVDLAARDRSARALARRVGDELATAASAALRRRRGA